ncbi:hypothetical protein QE152_g35756 [Popillia japonica]|uniref:Uncharacterized protein n=1 Tax=Popillia japonica TaxID=7064 RepID=A0AAW1IED6_POPJA
MKHFIILTTLTVLIISTQCKHHKKKQTGLFGFFPDLPKLSHHLFKLAFKGSADDSHEDDHYDEGLDCDHYGGKHKHKHGYYHKDKKVAYRPYYVDQDYLVQSPGYPYQVSAPAPAQAYYATSHTTLIPIQEQSAYASHLPQNYESLDNYNLHHVQNVHDHNLHQSLF